MSSTVAPATLADLVPVPGVRTRALALDTALVLTGAALVAGLAQLRVPLWPVPVTGQTLGVLLVGAALGARRGPLAMGVYALAGVAGLPVAAPLADGSHLTGTAWLTAPSFGYVLGFALSAAVLGTLAGRGWDRRPLTAVVALLLGQAAVYAIGLPWLALALSRLGVPSDALLHAILAGGLWPFLVGDAVKLLIAALALPAAWRLLGRRSSDGR